MKFLIVIDIVNDSCTDIEVMIKRWFQSQTFAEKQTGLTYANIFKGIHECGLGIHQPIWQFISVTRFEVKKK